MGGLSKKAFLIKDLTAKAPVPTLILSAGNLLFKKETLSATTRKEAERTALGVLEASRLMGDTVSGIGTKDLAAGTAFLRQSAQQGHVQWVSLNLLDKQGQAPLFAPYLIKKVGTLKVALLGLTDHKPMARANLPFRVESWRARLAAVLTEVRPKADMVIILSNYSYSENQAMARQHKEVDLIFQAGHAMGNRTPLLINQALLAQTDIRGKYLGVMDMDWQGPGVWQEKKGRDKMSEAHSLYSNQFIALRRKIPNDPQVEAQVQQTMQQVDQLKRHRR